MFIQSKTFWRYASITAVLSAILFAWELGMLSPPLPMLPRTAPTATDLWFAGATVILLALNVGLLGYKKEHG